MEKKRLTKTVVLGMCLVLILSLELMLTPVLIPAAAKTVTLKGIRPFDYPHRETRFYRELLSRVNAKMEGRLQIQDVGGSEVYPPREQFEAVRSGVVDFVIAPAGYSMGAFPEGQVMYLTFGATPADLRKGGLIKALDEMCRRKNDVAVLAAPGYFTYNVYLKEPIKTLDDIKGRKIRVASSYIPVIEGLGAAATSVVFSELYTALEKGIVDGFCWPSTGAVDLGVHEHVSYQVYPYFWSSCSVLFFMNADRLDGLPSDIRNDFMNIVRELENETVAHHDEYVTEELKVTRPAGVKPIVVSDKEWWHVQELHWNGTLKRFQKIAPENFETLKQIVVDAGWYPPKKVPPVPSL